MKLNRKYELERTGYIHPKTRYSWWPLPLHVEHNIWVLVYELIIREVRAYISHTCRAKNALVARFFVETPVVYVGRRFAYLWVSDRAKTSLRSVANANGLWPPTRRGATGKEPFFGNINQLVWRSATRNVLHKHTHTSTPRSRMCIHNTIRVELSPPFIANRSPRVTCWVCAAIGCGL